jgi:hypothetical protein
VTLWRGASRLAPSLFRFERSALSFPPAPSSVLTPLTYITMGKDKLHVNGTATLPSRHTPILPSLQIISSPFSRFRPLFSIFVACSSLHPLSMHFTSCLNLPSRRHRTRRLWKVDHHRSHDLQVWRNRQANYREGKLSLVALVHAEQSLIQLLYLTPVVREGGRRAR